MTWVRLDDGITEHVKITKVGILGYAFHTAAIVYCGRNLTDGFVPFGIARHLLPLEWVDDEGRIWTAALACGMAGRDGDEMVEEIIGQLLAAELWEEVAGGYIIHDYLDYNPSRDQVRQERDKKRAAGQAGGRASAQARATAPDTAPAQAKSKPVPVPVPLSEPTPLRSVSAPEGFEEFWNAYPLKRGKRKAEGKYQIALSRASAAEILAGAKAYAVEVRGREASKIKYPEGWLEGDRWADLATPDVAPEPERTYFEAQPVDEEAVAGFASAAAANPPSWSKRKDPA